MNEISKKIYSHLSNEEINRNISIEKTEPILIDPTKIKECRTDTEERLKIKLKTGHCSKLLIEQLSIHRANYGEKFGDKIEFYNTSEILDLIENIENDKLNGLPFTGEKLSGYLHIHHSTYASIGYSVVRNVKEYWFKKGEIRKKRIIDFEKIVNKYGKDNISPIAITMHQKAISNKELKGEWLIYKKYNGKNYYLCLASHREGRNRIDSDANIFNNKISKCLTEFVELK